MRIETRPRAELDKRTTPLSRVILEIAGTPNPESGEVGEFYGYNIAKSVKERIDSDSNLTSSGAIYKALRRLEGQGLISSRWELDAGPTPTHFGIPRRYYRVTEAGLEVVNPQELQP